MLAFGWRHGCLLLVLTLLATGTPYLMAQGRPLHHDDEQSSARADERRNKDNRRSATFAAGLGEMIHACTDQAPGLRNVPLESVAQAIQLKTDDQRVALEQVRSSAESAARRLDANCPKSIPAELGAKLDTLDNGLSVAVDSLRRLRPALVKLYALLDDEQKGRLVALSISRDAVTPSGRAGNRKDRGSEGRADQDAKSICAQWAAKLRTWLVGQIDAGMQLSDTQRAALYELSAAIYRSAGDLVEACPVENPVTPVGRLDATYDELEALRQDIVAIRPSAAAFESALNDVQRKRLAQAMDAEKR